MFSIRTARFGVWTGRQTSRDASTAPGADGLAFVVSMRPACAGIAQRWPQILLGTVLPVSGKSRITAIEIAHPRWRAIMPAAKFGISMNDWNIQSRAHAC